MKREKRYYGGWGKSGRSKRGDRFWRLKAPDALPGSIMMPYRGSRWFRRSNCEDTKRDGDRPETETHTSTYMQMQAHTHLTHIVPGLKNALLEISLAIPCSVLADSNKGYQSLLLHVLNKD